MFNGAALSIALSVALLWCPCSIFAASAEWSCWPTEAQGIADDLLKGLRLRGSLTDDQDARLIVSVNDIPVLKRWEGRSLEQIRDGINRFGKQIDDLRFIPSAWTSYAQAEGRASMVGEELAFVYTSVSKRMGMAPLVVVDTEGDVTVTADRAIERFKAAAMTDVAAGQAAARSVFLEALVRKESIPDAQRDHLVSQVLEKLTWDGVVVVVEGEVVYSYPLVAITRDIVSVKGLDDRTVETEALSSEVRYRLKVNMLHSATSASTPVRKIVERGAQGREKIVELVRKGMEPVDIDLLAMQQRARDERGAAAAANFKRHQVQHWLAILGGWMDGETVDNFEAEMLQSALVEICAVVSGARALDQAGSTLITAKEIEIIAKFYQSEEPGLGKTIRGPS